MPSAAPLLSAPWAITRPCSLHRGRTSVPSVQHYLGRRCRVWKDVGAALLSRTGASPTDTEFPLPIEWVSKCGFPPSSDWLEEANPSYCGSLSYCRHQKSICCEAQAASVNVRSPHFPWWLLQVRAGFFNTTQIRWDIVR